MLDELAAVVDRIDAAATDARNFDPLLATLVGGRSRLFASALLFKGGYAGNAFVLLDARGATLQDTRSWLR